MSQATDDLLAARDLIAEPEHWTQFFAARGASGEPVEIKDEAAVAFCSIGALARVTGCSAVYSREAFDRFQQADSYLRRSVGWLGSVAGFNDSRSHTAVMDLWDQAIRLSKES